jgi:hypothetical protein
VIHRINVNRSTNSRGSIRLGVWLKGLPFRSGRRKVFRFTLLAPLVCGEGVIDVCFHRPKGLEPAASGGSSLDQHIAPNASATRFWTYSIGSPETAVNGNGARALHRPIPLLVIVIPNHLACPGERLRTVTASALVVSLSRGHGGEMIAFPIFPARTASRFFGGLPQRGLCHQECRARY